LRRYPVSLSHASRQILRHLHPDIKRSVRKALYDLSRSPYQAKPLKEELEGLWSLPVYRHRIIYQIEKNAISVVFIGPRRNVYERLRELLTEK
jgi:mRNA-degrading endonuclease RelE of RelBE toxin-antitoxin system